MSVALSEVAPIGHNQPPEPDPYEAIRANCEDLYMEAKHWLDGGQISTDAEAEVVDRILTEARDAYNAAEAQRVIEKEPHDKAAAAVQEKYAPFLADTKKQKGTMVRLQEACKAALEPWRKKKLAVAEAKAEAIRLEAEAKAKAAADAMRASAGDLTGREDAEALVKEAEVAQRQASLAAKATTHGTGLTTYYVATLTTPRDAMLHYMKEQPAEFTALCQRLADADVRGGKRSIPGFTITPDKRAR